MKIELKNNNGFKWYSSENIWVKGYLFDEQNNYYSGEELLNYFDLNSDMYSQLNKINGCFSLVIVNNKEVILANDIVRSFPLFYTYKNNELIISDKIEGNFNETYCNETEINEFLMCGYTVGASTLLNPYKQVQAGEVVFLDGEKLISTDFYYNHFHKDFILTDEKEYFKDLTKITESFIKRLIKSAENRTIVLPLSGGYDSRYIVAGLKKHGYENVICFTYGGKNSYEVATAKRVTDQLNYKHYIIDYTDEKFIDLLETEEFNNYLSFGFNYSSLPHIQDFIGLTELRAKNLIPKDSIIVPGFCGDLLGGSYIPVEMKENKTNKLLKQELQEYILWRHLGNSSVEISKKNKDDIKIKIKELLTQSNVNNIDEFVSYNEDFFTKHKVSKFVVNAVRMYDYFGYEWRLPLWDKELIEYWYKVPNELRVNSYLYDKYLLEILFKDLNIDFKKKNTLAKNKFLLQIRKILPISILKIIKELIMKLRKQEDVNNFTALESFLLKDLSHIKPKDFNSIWSAWIIKKYLGKNL